MPMPVADVSMGQQSSADIRSMNEGLGGTDADVVDVVMVCIGRPQRGMGWYHTTQFLDLPDLARVTAIVEPFFMNNLSSAPDDFLQFKSTTESKHGTKFYGAVSDLPPITRPTLALISGRAADNAAQFNACVEKGIQYIYLEKPGATSSAELVQMKNLAAKHLAKVYLGYNKNVSSYVRQARDFAAGAVGSTLTFFHNNTFTQDGLGECFERNCEGMLRNMAIHELALVVTFLNVRSDTTKSIELSPKIESEIQTIGPYTDFVRLGFTMTTECGISVSLLMDRCGGPDSGAIVHSADGEELFRSTLPHQSHADEIERKQREQPQMAAYFFTNSDDYHTMKVAILNEILNADSTYDSKTADGIMNDIADMDIGIEAMRLAEHLTPVLLSKSGHAAWLSIIADSKTQIGAT